MWSRCPSALSAGKPIASSRAWSSARLFAGHGAFDEDDHGAAGIDDRSCRRDVDLGVEATAPDWQQAADVAHECLAPAMTKERRTGADEPRPRLGRQRPDDHERVDPTTVDGHRNDHTTDRSRSERVDTDPDGRHAEEDERCEPKCDPGDQAQAAVGLATQPIETLGRRPPSCAGERVRPDGRAPRRQRLRARLVGHLLRMTRGTLPRCLVTPCQEGG